MFKPMPMTRLSLLILKQDMRVVLRYLGQAGVAELTRATAGPDAAPLPAPVRSGEIERVKGLSTRLENLRRLLPPRLSNRPAAPIETSLEQAAKQLDELEQQSGVLLKHRAELQKRLAELTVTAGRLSGYRGVDLPLDRSEDSSFLHFVTGSLPAKNFESLKASQEVAKLPLREQDGRLYLIAMTTKSRRTDLDQALEQAGFQAETLPAVADATVDGVAEQNQREQKQIAEKLSQVDAELQTLTETSADVLARIETTTANERRLLEAEQNFTQTESSVLITGWLPDTSIARMEKGIHEITNGCCLVNLVPADQTRETEIPVLLQQPAWLRPFGKIVTAFGLPRYRELEPTLFVAVSFVLMFGMMFGDVGHGAVLVLGGVTTLFASRQRRIHDVGLLLLAGGISSMIFGALYGSCFGLESFKRFALWQDPLEGNPARLMFAAIGLGILLISFGLILNIINRFRSGDFVGGWLDKFGVAGLVFYWGTLGLLAGLSTIKSLNLLTPAIVLFLVLPFVGWMCKEPLEYFRNRRTGMPMETGSGWLASVIESLAGAFEGLLSFLANTISFVRLAAYAMSHAALLLAAFMMADTVRHLSAAGLILSVAVIVLGNMVAILLEGTIASVQALRLEYYEFFGKFFGGSGRPFQPFHLQTTTTAETPD